MRAIVSLLASIALAFTLGCSQSAPQPADHDHDHDHSHDHGDHAADGKGHTHGAWWCDAHGVPESVCGLCDSKLAAEMQKKGDWCQDHDRPDSQCFVCHPELEAKFAAQYVAKYGKQPPKAN